MTAVLFKKGLVLTIICLFIGVSIVPNIIGTIIDENKNIYITGDFYDTADLNSYSLPSNAYGYIGRDRMIEIAEGYLYHEWYPAIDNIYHGTYETLRIDTPDRDTYTNWPDDQGWKANQLNLGIPYMWGGFSSISGFNLSNPIDFDEQYTGSGNYTGIIHFAGDIYTNKNYASNRACGVDCSGFVSRCWNLPNKHGTYTLPYASSQIKFEELEKGDIINIPHYHVILFVEFMDDNRTSIRTIEAGGGYPNVNEQILNIRSVSDDGFYVSLEEYPEYREFGLYRYNYISTSPLRPTINGPTSGKTGREYTYNSTSFDEDDDKIWYNWSWGDGTFSDWIGPYTSGDVCMASHIWDEKDDYEIKVKAKDEHGLESDWSDPLPITMPKNKPYINTPFLRFLENHPHMFPLLRQMLGL